MQYHELLRSTSQCVREIKAPCKIGIMCLYNVLGLSIIRLVGSIVNQTLTPF